MGEKCIGDNNENLTLSDDAKLRVWKNHHQNLLFSRDKNFLNGIEVVEGPEDMMMATIKQLKQREAGRLSGVMVKMIKAAVKEIVTAITNCKDSFIVNCCKGKSDATDRGNCTGLRLIDRVIKDLGRVVEILIRSQVDIKKDLRSLVR